MSRKISQMTEATEIKSGDISVVVQDGETKQFPLDLLVTKEQADGYKTVVETQLADYEQEITDIKNKYDKELYSPTITVTNTSMVKTGQGDAVDYSASVEDSIAKSAILSGSTLVNLLYGYSSTNNYEVKINHGNIVGKVLIKNLYKGEQCYVNRFDSATNKYKGASKITSNNFILELPEGECIRSVYDNKQIITADELLENAMIIKYQEGMENWDIPYFEGMQSVKMPVLTTTGKNLFDDAFFKNTSWSKNVYAKSDNYLLKPNTKYTFTLGKGVVPSGSQIRIGVETSDGVIKRFLDYNNTSGVTDYIQTSKSINFTTTDTGVIRFDCYHNKNEQDKLHELLVDIQIEEGSTATPYEPYKTNILTVNEEVTLRGIGDVKDTLNCLTGELTQRIGEIVLDGSEKWSKMIRNDLSTPIYRITLSTNSNVQYNTKHIRCNMFVANGYAWTDGEHIWIDNYNELTVHTDRFNSLEDFKSYINNSNLIVQYTVNESVKTVVLNPSGTLASKTPYMWKNGNIQLSSDGLIPDLDYAVITSRVGVIENNMSETIANEKRIHSLEVILAQSTISAANDAVLLQSDLEATTMSVDGAQLDTGNTQDDFLYEMILLLIEKNAYDESLFDKVCTFYLYGKLSDEQFTNIYNLLYPVEE